MIAELVHLALVLVLAWSLGIVVRAAMGIIAGPSGDRFWSLRRIASATPLLLLGVPPLFIGVNPGLPLPLVLIDYGSMAIASLIWRWDIRDHMVVDLWSITPLLVLSALPLISGTSMDTGRDGRGAIVVIALAATALADLWTQVGARVRGWLLVPAGLATAVFASTQDLLTLFLVGLGIATTVRYGVLGALAGRFGRRLPAWVTDTSRTLVEQHVRVVGAISPWVAIAALHPSF